VRKTIREVIDVLALLMSLAAFIQGNYTAATYLIAVAIYLQLVSQKGEKE
jgi:hypothetical protein